MFNLFLYIEATKIRLVLKATPAKLLLNNIIYQTNNKLRRKQA